LLTSWMTMLVDPDLALGTLQTLARFQGTKEDDNTEEQPGRILHEMRFGETAALALGGGRIYYGSVDATPPLVMLGGEVARGGDAGGGRRRVAACRRRRARVDREQIRRPGPRRLRRIPPQDRPRSAEPGLEGLLGLDALHVGSARGTTDRTL